MAATVKDTHENIQLIGDPASSSPLIICFHGSGDSCASWAPVVVPLEASFRVLLWDRELHDTPELVICDMLEYLDSAHLLPPYVLVAHSYGGIFARTFLQQRPNDVAGMVLVETGQETPLNPEVERQQYEKQILGDNPLVVIRGNTLRDKWKQLEEALAATGSGAPSPSLVMQKEMLYAADQEDERLKKAQLALSRNHRYVHLPDCGHGVIREKPEIVEREIQWVMDHLQVKGDNPSSRWNPMALSKMFRKRI